MNESIRLVVRLMFFNICIPVLSVAPATNGTNPDLADVRLQSSVEFLSEYGDVVVKRMCAPQPLVLHIYEEPEAPDDQWVYDFGMEELISERALSGRPGRHLPEDAPAERRDSSVPDKSILFEHSAASTVAPDRPGASDAVATARNTAPRGPVRSKAPAGKETDGQGASANVDAESQAGPGGYNITLSRSNYLLFRILNLFNIKGASLSYEYTELDYIPLVLQILLHIPLILTGVIIFVVVMTLDPELNANLVKNEIDKLPSTKYTAEMGLSSCPVCLDEFVVEQEIRILGCRHSFHKHCIDAWLVHTLKCPICRKGVSSMSDAPQFEMYQTYYYV